MALFGQRDTAFQVGQGGHHGCFPGSYVCVTRSLSTGSDAGVCFSAKEAVGLTAGQVRCLHWAPLPTATPPPHPFLIILALL